MIADRMRTALHNAPYVDPNGQQVALSMSIGVAALSQHPGSLEELIKFADQAMYAAKDQGRNQVVAFRRLD